MEISLVKGQKVDLTKGTTIDKIMIGCGWDAGFDVDASIFMLNEAGKAVDVVYFNNLTSSGIVHLGDNRTGEGDGDDEVIKVTLSEIPANVTRLKIVANIYNAGSKNFGQVQNAFARVVDEATGTELCRFDLSEDYSIYNNVMIGDIYKHNGEWKFNAVGEGANGSLSDIKQMFS